MQLSTRLRTTALSLVTACACTTAALAQTPKTTNPRADALFERAAAMEVQPSTAFSQHLRRTAKLYLKSAELRSHSDPLKVESLRRAGSLLVTVNPQRSRELYERAGRTAFVNQDNFLAAGLYTDAAWIVARQPTATAEEIKAAEGFLDLARLLVEGPTVTMEQRHSILRRIDGAAVIVAQQALRI